jgi:hypothetical protein
MVLLSAAGAAFMAGTQATALLTDDAILVARAHSLSAAAGERVQYAPCAAGGATQGHDLPRVHVAATPVPGGGLQGTSVTATLLFSPFAYRMRSGMTATELSLSGARACP